MNNSIIKEKMKKFEKMINTADEQLAQELVAPDAAFYTPASSVFTEGKVICPLYIG